MVPTLSALINVRNHLMRLRMAGGSICDMFLGAATGFGQVGGRSDYMYRPIQTPRDTLLTRNDAWHPRDIRLVAVYSTLRLAKRQASNDVGGFSWDCD